MNSQGIAEDAKCGRVCLNLGVDARLLYELADPVSSDCKDLFNVSSPNLAFTRITFSKGIDPFYTLASMFII